MDFESFSGTLKSVKDHRFPPWGRVIIDGINENLKFVDSFHEEIEIRALNSMRAWKIYLLENDLKIDHAENDCYKCEFGHRDLL